MVAGYCQCTPLHVLGLSVVSDGLSFISTSFRYTAYDPGEARGCVGDLW
jgi:hypothetical protein